MMVLMMMMMMMMMEVVMSLYSLGMDIVIDVGLYLYIDVVLAQKWMVRKDG